MFFDRSKITTPVLCRILQETLMVSIGPVVSEEKTFERNNIKNSKKKKKKATTPTWLKNI